MKADFKSVFTKRMKMVILNSFMQNVMFFADKIMLLVLLAVVILLKRD